MKETIKYEWAEFEVDRARILGKNLEDDRD